ncbi:MAG TPA: GNAT family N-acetyltransferase [Rickettsiales bacterium]|nr:GNAT family N-acetyltransferase [Rickettsiales bacterium]
MDIQKIAFGSPLYDLSKRLREQVLRLPLGLVLSAQDTEGEENQIHIAAIAPDGSVTGTIILKPASPSLYEIRGVAVAVTLQGKGLGQKLVSFAEHTARQEGVQRIEMAARITAQSFYEKLGYRIYGEPFIKSTIPHIKMEKLIAFGT